MDSNKVLGKHFRLVKDIQLRSSDRTPYLNNIIPAKSKGYIVGIRNREETILYEVVFIEPLTGLVICIEASDCTILDENGDACDNLDFSEALLLAKKGLWIGCPSYNYDDNLDKYIFSVIDGKFVAMAMEYNDEFTARNTPEGDYFPVIYDDWKIVGDRLLRNDWRVVDWKNSNDTVFAG